MELQEKVGLFKALADGSRLRAMNALLERAHCVEELAQRLSLSPSTMSFHLRKLEAAGLVEKHHAQYYAVYAARTEPLSEPLSELLRLTPPAEPSKDKEQRRLLQYRERVLRSFFRKGKLTQLPKQWKKRVLVAEEFLKDFEPGRHYSEQEVSERIAERFHDYCTIRRILVEEGYMTRHAGVYRLTELQPEKKEFQKKESQKKESQKKESRTMSTRSELIRQYKETERQAGIFQIKNTANGRVLLGSSLNLHGPLNKHRFMLKFGAHPSARLQKDWQEYGPDAFIFEIIEIVKPTDDPDFSVETALRNLENQWLERLAPTSDRGYNTNLRIRE